MQVILTQSVQGVGKAGETAKVADGYARNYLIPRRFAVEASKGNLRNLEKIQADATQREAENRSAAEKVFDAIDGTRITVPARVSPDGSKLYGAITTQDLAKHLLTATGQELDKRSILTDAIKVIGSNNVPVRVYAGLTAHITVVVYPEGQKPPAPEMPAVEAAPEPVAAAEPVSQANVESAPADQGSPEDEDAPETTAEAAEAFEDAKG